MPVVSRIPTPDPQLLQPEDDPSGARHASETRDRRLYPPIRTGCVVAIRYTLLLDDGTVVEDSTDQPFRYLHGAGNIVPGLEHELEGCRAGDRLAVSVPPDRGYGTIHPGLVRRIRRSDLPRDTPLEPGESFLAEVEGVQLTAWVTGHEGEHLVVSFNHPLAGETLHFAVEILSVRAARREELSSGRPL